MERTEWKNLNGLWDYAIIEKGKHSPSVFDVKILVPFAVESYLSGVAKTVGAHGIVRPVNIPLNDAEQQKMKASADELQAIIDEAWKNPEFQEASKN